MVRRSVRRWPDDGRRDWPADSQQAGRRDNETHRVSQQRRRGPQRLCHEASQAGPGQLGSGFAALEFGIALHQGSRSKQGTDVDLIGGAEEDGGRAGQQRHGQQLTDRQHTGPRGERNTREQGGRDEVAGHHHPPGGQLVYPGARGQADDQPGQVSRRNQQANGEVAGMQQVHGQQRQRDDRHVVAQPTDCLPAPQQPEVPMPEQATGLVLPRAVRHLPALPSLGSAHSGGPGSHWVRPGPAMSEMVHSRLSCRAVVAVRLPDRRSQPKGWVRNAWRQPRR